MTPTLTLYDKPDPAVARAVHALLLAFNNTASGYEFDGRAPIIGGLRGSTPYGISPY